MTKFNLFKNVKKEIAIIKATETCPYEREELINQVLNDYAQKGFATIIPAEALRFTFAHFNKKLK